MAKRLGLGFLTAAPVVMLVIFLVVPAGASLLPAIVMAFPVALVAFAASRNGRLGRLRLSLLALLLMLEAGAIGVVVLGDSGVDLFGLPLSLHFLLLLVWLGPLLVTTLTYAATFSDLGVDDALLAELAKRRRR